MIYSVLSDFGIGILIMYWGFAAPLYLFIPVVLVERGILRKILYKERAFRNAFIINVVSTALGYIAAQHDWMASTYASKVIKFIIPGADTYTGDPFPVAWLYLFLTAGISCLLSIAIEGILLTVLEFRHAPIKKIWRVTLIANIASYATMIGLALLALLAMIMYYS